MFLGLALSDLDKDGNYRLIGRRRAGGAIRDNLSPNLLPSRHWLQVWGEAGIGMLPGGYCGRHSSNLSTINDRLSG